MLFALVPIWIHLLSWRHSTGIRFLYLATWFYQLGVIHPYVYTSQTLFLPISFLALQSWAFIVIATRHNVPFSFIRWGASLLHNYYLRSTWHAVLLVVGTWCSYLSYGTWLWDQEEDSTRSPLLASRWHAATTQSYAGIQNEALTVYWAQSGVVLLYAISYIARRHCIYGVKDGIMTRGFFITVAFSLASSGISQLYGDDFLTHGKTKAHLQVSLCKSCLR